MPLCQHLADGLAGELLDLVQTLDSHRRQPRDPLFDVGVSAEESAQSAARQWIDDHHLGGFRMLLNGIHGNPMCIVMDFPERGSQCIGIIADFCTRAVCLKLART